MLFDCIVGQVGVDGMYIPKKKIVEQMMYGTINLRCLPAKIL